MTNVKKRIKILIIGTLLALIPIVLAIILMGFLFITAEPASGTRHQQERSQSASIIMLIGLVMSGVALCGMGLYILDTLCRVLIVERQARKIEKLKREGKI